jgi:di/tricarboxylate transporter
MSLPGVSPGFSAVFIHHSREVTFPASGCTADGRAPRATVEPVVLDSGAASGIHAPSAPPTEEHRMPPGRPSWLARRVGLANSRRLLRRSLALQGTAGATSIVGLAGYNPDRHGPGRRRRLDLDGKQQGLAAVLGLVVTWWITEAIPIPITGVIGLCLCVIQNVASADDVFGSVADSTIFRFICSFIIAAGLLFVLPVDWGRRRFTPNWNQASRIDWETILLFGAGIALGSLMRETGLAKTIGEGLANALNVSNLVSITIICVVIAVIISETTSNTASAAIVVPIAIAISGAVQVDPVIPAMAAIFGANYGFMLPVSTPPNAIVYSSGMLPIISMVKTGAVFDVIGAVLCVVGVAVMANVVGLV